MEQERRDMEQDIEKRDRRIEELENEVGFIQISFAEESL